MKKFKPYRIKHTKNSYDFWCKFYGMLKADLMLLKKYNYTPLSKTDLIAGVLVGFRPTSNNKIFFAPWSLKTCNHSDSDIKEMIELIDKSIDLPNDSSYDYFIMDILGNILFSNCDISCSIDENEIIHLYSKEKSLHHFIYPAAIKKYKYKCFFCYGTTLDELNAQIENFSNKGFISKPKNFKKGFQPTPSTPYISQNFEKQ